MSGWIKLHRQIKDHWIYENPDYLKAWITILLEVNHADKKVLIGSELIQCKRGSSLNSLATWASLFGSNWTIRKARTFLDLLAQDKIIDKQGLRKTTRLTICKYDTYQSSCQADDTQTATQTTSRRQADDNKQECKELKRTIGERKEEFRELTKKKWSDLGGVDYLSNSETKAFFEYWVEHGDNDKMMRFEKEKSFGIGRRLGTWKKNNHNPINPNVRKNA